MRVTANVINAHLVCSYCIQAMCITDLDIIDSINVVGLAFVIFSKMCNLSLCGATSYPFFPYWARLGRLVRIYWAFPQVYWV